MGANSKKSVHILSYSGPHFPAFGQNTERYGVQTYQKSMMDRLTIFAKTLHYRFLTGFLNTRLRLHKI